MSRTFGACGEIIVQSGGGDVIDSMEINDMVSSGASGELYNIPVSSTKRIIITGFMPDTGTETNIEIKFGVRVVYTGSISDAPISSSLTVNQNATSTTNEFQGVSTVNELKGDYGEDLVISKTSSTTTLDLRLSYKIAS